MQILSTSIDSIIIGERHRALSEDAVTWLAESVKEFGLQQPISIRIAADGDTFLVAGRHRLEAMKRLGKTHIECIEIGDDEIRAELWEIAENLHRLDLTKEQRDEHIRRYAELLEARDTSPKIPVPQNAAMEIGYRNPPRPEKSIARRIAEETGLSDDTVRRALKPPARPKRPPARPQLSAAGKQLAALRKAWREASQTVRDHFLTEVNGQQQAA
jgi:hypothetical protein